MKKITDLQEYIKKIKHGGFKSFIKKALGSGVSVRTFSEEPSLINLEYKGKSLFCRRGKIPLNKRIGDFTTNKLVTKTILNDIGIKTPRGFVANSCNEALRLLKKNKLSYPLILKPLNGSLARGVTWDIQSPKDLKKAVNIFKKTKQKHPEFKSFMVEEMHAGDEYRILVFNENIISCVKKIPASVTGDGKSTIKKLIENFNKNRKRGFEIKIDKTIKKTLLKNKLKLDSVLPKNFVLKLRDNLNMSDGGRAVECTEKMSRFLKKTCVRAIKAAGLSFGGIDLIAQDITAAKNDYVIIEINANPYYNMHEKPLVEGKGVDVSKQILKHLFPNI